VAVRHKYIVDLLLRDCGRAAQSSGPFDWDGSIRIRTYTKLAITGLLESGTLGEREADGAGSSAGGRIARSAIVSRPSASAGVARASVRSALMAN